MPDKAKIHTTNYFDTFIETAEDSKADHGTVPPSKNDQRSVAEIQYGLISGNPYKYTSDDVIFETYAQRNDLTQSMHKEARQQFFSKGQPCLRASPLTKTYGFGVHSDSKGKIALYGMETEAYQKFLADGNIKKVKAMRSTKK